MELVTTAYGDRPTMDMALTGALLDAVAHGDAQETVRVFRPGPTLGFGRLNRARVGFADARCVALSHGRTPVLRWAGGHAAAYDPDCVLVEIIRRHARSIGGVEERFVDMVTLLREVLSRSA